jgi:hypothetical protein
MAHPNYTTKFAAGLLVFLQCHKNNYCVQMAQTLGGGVLYLAQFSLPTIEFVVWSFRIVIQDILLDQFFVVP